MRNPIAVSHVERTYRVQFFSTHPSAVIDDGRAEKMISRTHVLRLGKRDYDAAGETPEDAVASAKNKLAIDRQIDTTSAREWRLVPGFPKAY